MVEPASMLYVVVLHDVEECSSYKRNSHSGFRMLVLVELHGMEAGNYTFPSYCRNHTAQVAQELFFYFFY